MSLSDSRFTSTLTMPAPQPNPYANADWIRPEVAKRIPQWELIEAAIAGEEEVKALGTRVLPMPNATDQSAENIARYTQYLFRASYYNVPGRTLAGMAGYVFSKEPVATLPEALKSLTENVDGAGVTLFQQAKSTLRSVLAFGRAGLLVDYPVTSGVTTQADLKEQQISPVIVLYQPWNVINWDHVQIGAKQHLSLLVLREFRTVRLDEFRTEEVVQLRIYRREVTGVTLTIVQKNAAGKMSFVATHPINGKTGKQLTEIPFVFLGAQNNDATLDAAPLKDLVDLALAHFRNSADYEEACFIVGQPTPFFAGLSKQWVDEVMKGVIEIGSRAAVMLPVGGTAGLLQASENTMPHEAMEHKELQMVALGAKLVEQKKVQRTATEAGLDHAAEASVLVTAANNVLAGYRVALGFCALFVTGDGGKIEFDLATPLTRDAIDAPTAVALMDLWNNGVLGFEEIRWKLKLSGVAYDDDEKVKKEGEEKKKADQDAAIALEGAKSKNREKAGKENGKKGSRKEVKKAAPKE